MEGVSVVGLKLAAAGDEATDTVDHRLLTRTTTADGEQLYSDAPTTAE
jgi:hypothetical protein